MEQEREMRQQRDEERRGEGERPTSKGGQAEGRNTEMLQMVKILGSLKQK